MAQKKLDQSDMGPRWFFDFKFLWLLIGALFLLLSGVSLALYQTKIDDWKTFNLIQDQVVVNHDWEKGSWKLYRNNKYGIEIKYPETSTLAVATNAQLASGEQLTGNTIRVSFNNIANFKGYLSNSAFTEALKLVNNQWQVDLGSNQTIANAFCPIEHRTEFQKVPYYQIGDLRSGRDWNFAYVTKDSIIILSMLDTDVVSGLNPNIKFDNPKDVFPVTCSIN